MSSYEEWQELLTYKHGQRDMINRALNVLNLPPGKMRWLVVERQVIDREIVQAQAAMERIREDERHEARSTGA